MANGPRRENPLCAPWTDCRLPALNGSIATSRHATRRIAARPWAPDRRTLADRPTADCPIAEPPGPSRFYWAFVQEDGRWLIDEQIMLGPIDQDQIGTPTA
jgi:hypothetical protein